MVEKSTLHRLIKGEEARMRKSQSKIYRRDGWEKKDFTGKKE